MSACRRLQIDPYLAWCTKLNRNSVTLNQIEENVESSLERIGTGDLFLCRTPEAQTIRETMNKWDLLKLRSFCKAKHTVNKTKRQPTKWEKIFINPTSDKGLISKIYKELKKLDIKNLNNPIKKWGTQLILNRRISDDQKILKEMFNILSHQENANQNDSGIPYYTNQNG